MNGSAVVIARDLSNLAATIALAEAVAGLARVGDAILLTGPLGAGKSEFCRAFLRAASDDPELEVPSPSFTLAQTYDTQLGSVHHFDLWRVEGETQIVELGWEEALEGIVLVEWAEHLRALAPRYALSMTIAITGETTRRLDIAGWPDRIEALR